MREAAGCGVPSLLVTPSTVAEVVKDGRNGFLAANDAESYATRIREILWPGPALLARCGEKPRKRSTGVGSGSWSMCRPLRRDLARRPLSAVA